MKRAQSWIEAQQGTAISAFDELPGGAGARRYWRVEFSDGRRAVLMLALPENPAILPPALRVPADEIPFLDMTRYLSARGLPVPEILAVEPDERWLLIEDLGDTHLCDLPPDARLRRLREAIVMLARFHSRPIDAEFPFQREYDAEWIRFELQTFVEHGLQAGHGERLAPGLDLLATRIAQLPRVLCLRDYQSQNLMIDAEDRLRVLDYQDALLAPAELDLASLLYDSYVEIDRNDRAALLDAYERGRNQSVDPEGFALLVVVRKCKDFGRYRFLVETKQDLRYEPYLDRARQAVLEQLPRLPEDLRPLADLLRDELCKDSA